MTRNKALLVCLYAVLSCSLLPGGCATSVPVAALAATPWPARRVALNALQDWTITGNMSVTNEQEGWHASVHWTQQGPAYTIDLIGPLGQGRVRIWGDSYGVRVRTADGQVRSATDPEQLLEQAVGIRIPVNGLVYWVRGLPDPEQRSVLAGDAQGRLIRVEQDGWVIEYPRYVQVAELALPARIRAQKGDLRVQLVITEWNLQPPSASPTPA